MYKKIEVFIAACVALFIFGLTLITLGSILPELLKKYPEGQISGGTLASVLPAGILLGSLLFGPIVDRYGYKILLIVSVLVSAVSLGGLAYTDSATIIYVCIFFIGVGGGSINGGTSALVSDISSDNKGANLSLLGVSFGLGALGMPLLLGLLSKTYNYNTILAGISILMLIPAIYYFFIKFPSPKQPQGFPLKQGLKLASETSLLLTAFFLFFQSSVESLINNWTTSFLQHKLKIEPEKALFALTFYMVGLTVARLLLGVLLKKISSYILLLVSLGLIIIGNVVLYFSADYNIDFIALIITGLGLAGGFPIVLGYVGQLYPHLSGTAFSISLVIALIGNILINFLFGKISSTYSINYLPVAMIALTLVMIILLLVIKQRSDQKSKSKKYARKKLAR